MYFHIYITNYYFVYNFFFRENSIMQMKWLLTLIAVLSSKDFGAQA